MWPLWYVGRSGPGQGQYTIFGFGLPENYNLPKQPGDPQSPPSAPSSAYFTKPSPADCPEWKIMRIIILGCIAWHVSATGDVAIVSKMGGHVAQKHCTWRSCIAIVSDCKNNTTVYLYICWIDVMLPFLVRLRDGCMLLAGHQHDDDGHKNPSIDCLSPRWIYVLSIAGDLLLILQLWLWKNELCAVLSKHCRSLLIFIALLSPWAIN